MSRFNPPPFLGVQPNSFQCLPLLIAKSAGPLLLLGCRKAHFTLRHACIHWIPCEPAHSCWLSLFHGERLTKPLLCWRTKSTHIHILPTNLRYFRILAITQPTAPRDHWTLQDDLMSMNITEYVLNHTAQWLVAIHNSKGPHLTPKPKGTPN